MVKVFTSSGTVLSIILRCTLRGVVIDAYFLTFGMWLIGCNRKAYSKFVRVTEQVLHARMRERVWR